MTCEWYWQASNQVCEMMMTRIVLAAGWCRCRELRCRRWCPRDNTATHSVSPGWGCTVSGCWPCCPSSWSARWCCRSTWTPCPWRGWPPCRTPAPRCCSGTRCTIFGPDSDSWEDLQWRRGVSIKICFHPWWKIIANYSSTHILRPTAGFGSGSFQ